MQRRGVLFLIGILMGLLLSPAVVFGLLGVMGSLLALVLLAFVQPRFALLSGGLTGLGAAWLALTLNTVSICSQTSDFCGDANPWPWVLFAIVLIGAGLALAIWTLVRSRRGSPESS
jgi:hypothetical protein